MIGGLTRFLRETVPEIDISTWEKRVEEAERASARGGLQLERGNAASASVSLLRAVSGHCWTSYYDIMV
jgi:hypothetical protein